jgi:archaellum component FlaC
MCTHEFHTDCFIKATLHFLDNNNFQEGRCHTCRAHIVRDEMIQEVYNERRENQDAQVIKFLLETHPEFKDDVKSLLDTQKNHKSKMGEAKKKIEGLKREFGNTVAMAKEFIKDTAKIFNTRKQNLDEYKALTTASRNHTSNVNRFLGKWGIPSEWCLSSTLRMIAGPLQYAPRRRLWSWKRYLNNPFH